MVSITRPIRGLGQTVGRLGFSYTKHSSAILGYDNTIRSDRPNVKYSIAGRLRPYHGQHHSACADAGTAIAPLLRGGTRVRRGQPVQNPPILRTKVI